MFLLRYLRKTKMGYDSFRSLFYFNIWLFQNWSMFAALYPGDSLGNELDQR